MFPWYEMSEVCYVYLSDIALETFSEDFEQTRWFRRGWTLQELLTPSRVVFYDRDCKFLCTKSEYASTISRITGIDESALSQLENQRGGLNAYCFARRMSWAAARETTRTEDIAYSLLGIFGVNMPFLYGEGRRAFTRLQEEIIKRHCGESIFAFDLDTESEEPLGVEPKIPSKMTSFKRFNIAGPLLALSPKDFKDCGRLQHGAKSASPFTMTSVGLQIELPLVIIPVPSQSLDLMDVAGWVGLLNCRAEKIPESDLVGVLLKESRDGIFKRVPIGRAWKTSKQTMLVGERLAIQAIPTNITITREL